MSVTGREERLRQEVVELREEVRRLTARVDRQQDLIEELSSVQSELSFNSELGATERAVREVTEAAEVGSLGSYSVVPSIPAGVPEQPITVPEAPGYTWRLREEVAREIGAFLSRALRGENRGSSGRGRLRDLQSRVYIVVKDYDGGITTDPVRVFSQFSSCRALCQRRGSWGDSIFVGLPSAAEGEIAGSKTGRGESKGSPQFCSSFKQRSC